MCGDNVVHFTLQEKVQKRKTDRLTLPDTLGNLLRIFIEKYRPVLCKDPETVTQCFVGYHGKPMRKLIIPWSPRLVINGCVTEPKALSQAVFKKVGEAMPGRRIGPLSLRRIVVTEMLHAAAKNPNEFFQWASKHATLINTSQLMAETVYNCGNQTAQAKETLDTINNTLNINPSEELANTAQQQAANVTYLTKKDDKIEAIVGRRWHEGELQYECKLASGEKSWRDYGTLVGVTRKVHDYLRAESLREQGREEEAQAILDGPHPEQGEQQPAAQHNQQNMPSLETDASDSEDSDSESDNDCNSDIDFSDIEAFGGDESDNESDEDSMEQAIGQAVSHVATPPTRKRKRTDSTMASAAESCQTQEPPKKRQKSNNTVYEDVTLLNKQVVKPGDIVSVNPCDPKDPFWLAKVVSISSKNKVYVQWLGQQKKGFKLLNWYDNVNVGAIDKLASGGWTAGNIFKVSQV